MSTPRTLLVVIATYNEIENLPFLVDRLLSLIDDCEIVVVDDNSPDGTGQWCESESEKRDRLKLIRRSGKLGLGSATMEGLKLGRERGFEYIATMDADFSHSPDSMAKMWAEVRGLRQERFGVMIGSRYVAGGGIDGWPLHRRVASRMVNAFTRLVLRLPTRDNTGAFRIYRTSSLVEANVFSMTTSGYGYLEELLLMLHRAKFGLNEFPIVFTDREKGKSKANFSEGLSVLKNIWRLRKQR